jgi:hypothetical protein
VLTSPWIWLLSWKVLKKCLNSLQMCLKIIEWQTSVGEKQQIKKTTKNKTDLVQYQNQWILKCLLNVTGTYCNWFELHFNPSIMNAHVVFQGLNTAFSKILICDYHGKITTLPRPLQLCIMLLIFTYHSMIIDIFFVKHFNNVDIYNIVMLYWLYLKETENLWKTNINHKWKQLTITSVTWKLPAYLHQ